MSNLRLIEQEVCKSKRIFILGICTIAFILSFTFDIKSTSAEVVAPPIATIKANGVTGSITINKGENLNIQWSTVNATVVYGSYASNPMPALYPAKCPPADFSSILSKLSGSHNESTNNLGGCTMVYKIRVYGKDGQAVNAVVEVKIKDPNALTAHDLPVPILKANGFEKQITVNAGEKVNLSWSTTKTKPGDKVNAVYIGFPTTDLGGKANTVCTPRPQNGGTAYLPFTDIKTISGATTIDTKNYGGCEMTYLMHVVPSSQPGNISLNPGKVIINVRSGSSANTPAVPPPVQAPTAPTINLTADGKKEVTIVVGTPVRLAWTSTNAISVSGRYDSVSTVGGTNCHSGASSVFVGASGAFTQITDSSIGSVANCNYTYKVVAKSATGQEAQSTVLVRYIPKSAIQNPTPVTPAPQPVAGALPTAKITINGQTGTIQSSVGANVKIEWSSTNAIKGSGRFVGSPASCGSAASSVLSGTSGMFNQSITSNYNGCTYTYFYKAENATGQSHEASVSLQVGTPKTSLDQDQRDDSQLSHLAAIAQGLGVFIQMIKGW